jgi:endonuclease YncB( thermonuclease family)
MTFSSLLCLVMVAAPPSPAPDGPQAARDLSKLPRYKVLRIADAETIELKSLHGATPIRLAGVAAPAQAADSSRLRSRYLGTLIENQEVVLEHQPEQPPRKGGHAAWMVYRASDGLLINQAMVEGGYGITANNAPVALKPRLLAAEQAARAGQRGLWSPTAAAEAAELAAAAARLKEEHENDVKGLSDKHHAKRRAQNAAALRAAGPLVAPPGPGRLMSVPSTRSSSSSDSEIERQRNSQNRPSSPATSQPGTGSETGPGILPPYRLQPGTGSGDIPRYTFQPGFGTGGYGPSSVPSNPGAGHFGGFARPGAGSYSGGGGSTSSSSSASPSSSSGNSNSSSSSSSSSMSSSSGSGSSSGGSAGSAGHHGGHGR